MLTPTNTVDRQMRRPRRPSPRRPPRRSRAVLAPLVVLVVVLLVLDVASGPGGPTDRARGVVAAVLGPVDRLMAGIGRSLSDGARGLTGGTRREQDALRRENDALRLSVLTAQDDRRRVAELDALLHTAGLGTYRIVPARVVAFSTAQATHRMVTLDAGTRDGIRPDLTVLSGNGLVGRVLRAGPTTCDVLLLTDPDFSVGVRLESTGLIGAATGAGERLLSLRLLDAQTNVRAGARLVTLGSAGGRPFVPGVPVGQVSGVRTAAGTLSRTGRVTPFVTDATLDLVGIVVQPPRRDPRDAVLPPRPSTRPVAEPRPQPSPSPRPTP